MKRLLALLLLPLAGAAFAVNPNYSTDWIANTYGLPSTAVGNAARSLWVAPEGTVYTASSWNESAASITSYANGQVTGGIGNHGGPTGDAITGNSTSLWVAMGFNRIPPTPPAINTCAAANLYSAGCVYVYDRASGALAMLIGVSSNTTERRADTITGLATWGQFWAASDPKDNWVRLYKTNGTHVRDIPVTDPGALAFDRNGNIWVAIPSTGVVQQYSQAGVTMNSIQLSGGTPHSLYYDPAQFLYIGDAGPDQNIKVYDVHAAPLLSKTIGIQGGYLNTDNGAIRGQVGSLRFARVDGMGKDTVGNLYVLSEPWGKTWDNGRTGGTDIYAYSPAGTLLYNLQALNFEAVASPDPASDATYFYSGTNIYSCAAYPCGTSWKFVANSVDPFTYPDDARLNPADPSRGEHFGQVADIGSNRILTASGQNPDHFYFYHFDPTANSYIAIPDGVIPGVAPFNVSPKVTHGFDLDTAGGVWAGLDKTTSIMYWPLAGFDANGKPSWGAPVTYAIPATLGVLARVIYLPESDTLILADRITGSTAGNPVGTRVEVYHGWMAGNQTNPVVINLTSTNPMSLTGAGNYLFVGYVHTVPNIDAFNLTTGTLDITFTNSDPTNVWVGNDVDSEYGLRAMLRSNGEYVITKDGYGDTSIIMYRWTP